MNRWAKVAIGTAVIAVVAFVAFRMMRGPMGASALYGGDLEAESVPELPREGRWLNGEPPAAGQPLLVEAWHPK